MCGCDVDQEAIGYAAQLKQRHAINKWMVNLNEVVLTLTGLDVLKR